MISKYKLKIILWFTGLLTVIIFLTVLTLYYYLELHLKQEYVDNITEKLEWINVRTRTMQNPPLDLSVFRKRIIADNWAKYTWTFYDLRQHTDVGDRKYLLYMIAGSKIIVSSDEYKNIKKYLLPFKIKDNEFIEKTFSDKHFIIKSINKGGYTIYLGYDLTTIYFSQNAIFQVFLIVFPIGVLLAVISGFIVTQKSLKIIDNITKIAAKITSKNLNERISVPKSKDEITNLIVTLNSMIDRLDSSFTQIRQFSHDAAHEIRTPLTIVRGEIEELLKEEDLSDATANTLESILEEIQYLSAIANKLLMIHGLDAGRMEYPFEKIDISRIVDETFEDALVLAFEKEHILELLKNEKVEIIGNLELLVRLFWNIFENAIKYTPGGGRIEVSLEKIDSKAIITCKDNGIGIPEEDISKIFDRFYRVDKSRSRKQGGSGLGLAIVKWIIEMHKGEILVESKLGEGTEFKIIFPAV